MLLTVLSVLGCTQKTNLPSPLAPLWITFIPGQRSFSGTYVQIFSHWVLILPRVTHAGKRQEPEPRLYRGMYFWAFAPGAAHLSVPVSPWLVLQDEAVPGGAEHLCCKDKGCPRLSPMRHYFPCSMLLLTGTIIQKLRGMRSELSKNNSLNASVSEYDCFGWAWFLVLVPINGKHLPLVPISFFFLGI